MHFVVAPDSFKGSLTASEAGAAMKRAILGEWPEAEVTVVPMADGGEGTVEALVQSTGGRLENIQVSGPEGEPRNAFYGVIHRETAVLEAANICGLPMLPPERRNPMHTTTRGLGEAIRQLLDRGFRRFVIGLGGSATNDGGIGMLSALGARFTDHEGRLLEGYGRDLLTLEHADFKSLDPRLSPCKITVASDVTNPLLGPQGASFVFGPQKGATPEQTVQLDNSMERYAALVEKAFGTQLRDREGAGAAGGLGFALLALGAEMVPGALVVEQLNGLKQKIAQADWIITGEGRSDGQTAFGKLPWHVAKWSRESGKPAILISGSLGPGSETLFDLFGGGCFSVVRQPSTLQECIADAEYNLELCARNVIRLLRKASANRN